MNRNAKPIKGAALAGGLGALVLWGIQLVMMQMPGGTPPLGTAFAGQLFGLQGSTATLIGLLLFVGAGAVWGAIYATVVPRIAWVSGLIFGFVPWLVVMFAVYPILSKPVFAGGDLKGILAPLILNCIWGALTGALTPKFEAPRPPVVV